MSIQSLFYCAHTNHNFKNKSILLNLVLTTSLQFLIFGKHKLEKTTKYSDEIRILTNNADIF